MPIIFKKWDELTPAEQQGLQSSKSHLSKQQRAHRKWLFLNGGWVDSTGYRQSSKPRNQPVKPSNLMPKIFLKPKGGEVDGLQRGDGGDNRQALDSEHKDIQSGIPDSKCDEGKAPERQGNSGSERHEAQDSKQKKGLDQ